MHILGSSLQVSSPSSKSAAGQSDNTAGRALAVHVAMLGSIPGWGLPCSPQVTPECREPGLRPERCWVWHQNQNQSLQQVTLRKPHIGQPALGFAVDVSLLRNPCASTPSSSSSWSCPSQSPCRHISTVCQRFLKVWGLQNLGHLGDKKKAGPGGKSRLKALALAVAEPVSIPSTTYDPLST